MAKALQTVLVAPLDWGLGHATRCIPVVEKLIEKECTVVLGGSGIGLNLLRSRFPQLDFMELPSYNITYPETGSMHFHLIKKLPSLLKTIDREKRTLEKAIDTLGITHVISDNRYGLHSNKARCVLMTHQVHIASGLSIGLADQLLFLLHKIFLQKFDVIWIVDFGDNEGLAGKLSSSKGLKIPFLYTGTLSRFKKPELKFRNDTGLKYEHIALLSGPEPQRSLFEKKCFDYFHALDGPCLIVTGKGNSVREKVGSIDVWSSIQDDELVSILKSGACLYGRPGYSTLMDLARLEHEKAIFIPTPGQTEQEYLGKRISENHGYTIIQQKDFPNSGMICSGSKLPDMQNGLLERCIQGLLSA